MICGICSSVICLCNGAISFVLLYCLTLMRLSSVTIKGYLLACLIKAFKYINTSMSENYCIVYSTALRFTDDVVQGLSESICVTDGH